jgi:hypothetical protein
MIRQEAQFLAELMVTVLVGVLFAIIMLLEQREKDGG